MGYSWVIPVIVGILILGAVGFSQEADASHAYFEKIDYWTEKYGDVSFYFCDTSESQYIHPSVKIVVPDYSFYLSGDPPCVINFKDRFLNEGTIYNHGTIIIDPRMSTATNRGTIFNHGTIIIKPVPFVDPSEELRRDGEWHDEVWLKEIAPLLGGTSFSDADREKYEEEVKKKYNILPLVL